MSDRTGRALGTLSPVVYFVNSAGKILLPPIDVKDGIGATRQVYEQKYRREGYEWREAGTLQAVQKLQKQLIEQEQRILDHMGEVDERRRKAVHARTSSTLRQRMASSSTSVYEREFIKLWLDMVESKQDKYTERFTHRNMYLQALEFDANYKIEDHLGE